MSDKFLHIISRDQAIDSGINKYFTGRKCSKGHIDQRYVSSYACMSCLTERQSINIDAKIEYDRQYRRRNDAKLKALKAVWISENREKVNGIKRAWKERNPGSVIAAAQTRRAAISGAEGTFNNSDVVAIFEKQLGRCASCSRKLKKSGKHKFHVDHIMPLSKGGSNWPSNLQCLCPTCNLRKHAKLPDEWAKENGKLL